MTTHIVELGHPMELEWPLTNARYFDNGVPDIDVHRSGATITVGDGEPHVLRLGYDMALTRDPASRELSLRVSVSDTSEWGEGEVQYTLLVVDTSGQELTSDSGVVVIVSPTHDVPDERPVRPWDLLNPKAEWATKEEAADRLAICRSCPFLTAGVCRKCGCAMALKVKLGRATCPIGRW